MKKYFILFFVMYFFINSFPAIALDCNKEEAAKVFELLRESGTKIDDHGVILHIDYNNWTNLTMTQKNQFLRGIANADACIQGKARKIVIYAWDEEVAYASPYFGFKVEK